MANPEHLKILKQGVEAWNNWRKENPDIKPDLWKADLREAELVKFDLSKADLSGARLDGANLLATNLSEANLSEATLRGATLSSADFRGTDLKEAKLSEADLSLANLSRAYLYKSDLSHANLVGANLIDADLSGADLRQATLWNANLRDAKFRTANLSHATLRGANLINADLRGTNLVSADLSHADLNSADLRGARMNYIVFGNTNLLGARNLDSCIHEGPSIIDQMTLVQSGKLPEVFLKGCGLSDDFIRQIPFLFWEKDAFEFYSCFISYSSKDEDFPKRLYADLQREGVRCWFAPEDMKIGDKIRLTIDESIRIYDKLLLILSENSINSQWVEQEVETALRKERQQKSTVLFPIRLDAAAMNAEIGWPALVKDTRHIGDFTNWKHHDSYEQAFQRLLRDLKSS